MAYPHFLAQPPPFPNPCSSASIRGSKKLGESASTAKRSETRSKAFSEKRGSIRAQEAENPAQSPLQALQSGSGGLIAGIHGIFSRGKDSTDLLLAKLHELGHRTKEVDRGCRPAILSGIFARYYARKLIRDLKGEVLVHLVTHSFGARVALEAMKLGQKFGKVYLFNPAIPRDTVFPVGAYEHITVIANPNDKILTYGKLLLHMLGYGDLGRVGYHGPSENVATISTTLPCNAGLAQHGHAFHPLALAEWAEAISSEIKEAA